MRVQIETVCEACGLVVDEDAIAREMSPSVHKQGEVGNGPVEWSLERTTQLRVDRGLHTTFFLGSDGYGNSLTKAQKDKFGRLRRRHKRFQMESKRAIRLNEGLRDIQMIVGNLGLPGFVTTDAAALLKQASEERLPGGRMAWEALAALTRFRVELGHLEGPLQLCERCSPGGLATYWTRDLEAHLVEQ
nr:hypothetical protein [Salinigranum marinum]